MNYLYKDVYTTLYFTMNDLNALNKMFTVTILVKDRYFNKGLMSSTAPNVIMCHSDL